MVFSYLLIQVYVAASLIRLGKDLEYPKVFFIIIKNIKFNYHITQVGIIFFVKRYRSHLKVEF